MTKRKAQCKDGKDCMHRQALRLSYFTVGYNLIEGALSVFFGAAAGSIALISFGLDSFIESLSGAIMVWRFSDHHALSKKEAVRKESKAILLVGYSFLALSLYVLFESASKLYRHDMPQPTLAGVVIALISICIMAFLFDYKQKAGTAIKSRSLLADSKQTLACIFLSIALLAGVGLNYLFGMWWADPLAGIIIAFFLIKEGKHTLREKELCC